MCACARVCVAGRACGVTFWDKKAVVQLMKEELGTRIRESLLPPSGPSLVWGGGRTQPLLWPHVLGRSPSHSLAHCRVLFCGCASTSPLFSALVSSLQSRLLCTCPHSCLPPSRCARFLSWEGGKEKAQHGRLSQPWKSRPPHPRSLRRTPSLRAQTPHRAQRRWCLILPGPRGLAT